MTEILPAADDSRLEHGLAVLFAQRERLGWQFRPPVPPRLSPLRDDPPAVAPGEDVAQAWRRWRKQITEHELLEQYRVGSDPWWHSVRPQNPWSVLPVFGGTRVGWEALLITLGSALLGSGHRLIVADMSEWSVTGSLEMIVRQRGLDVRHQTIAPRDRGSDLFADLTADGLIDLILDALAIDDPSAQRRDHIEDRALLRAIAVHLRPRVGIGRLRSALRILLREEPLADPDAGLSTEEFDALTELFGSEVRSRTDLLGRSYQLEHALEELSAFAPAPNDRAAPAAAAPAVPLLVHSLSGGMTTHEHDLAADLLTQRLVRDLSSTADDGVLVLVGADRIYERTLDRILALAEGRALRVIPMFRRLRRHALAALGAGDTSIFMRLSDYREATDAAEQIGRSHRFVLSTTTQTRSASYDRGASWQSGQESGRSAGTTFGSQFSSSRGVSSSESQSRGGSSSQGGSLSDSRSYDRVYEFDVEPRQLQGLPDTAFFLVEHAIGTALLADSDPTIALDVPAEV